MSTSPRLSMARRVVLSGTLLKISRFTEGTFRQYPSWASITSSLDAGSVAHELVGPEADRRALEAVVAHTLHVLLRHDPARAGHDAPVVRHEIGPRLVENEPYARRARDHHVLDLVVEHLGALGPMEAE